jgi:exopolysaccharide biosynthesis polyprenyl glycosylphosphotransferase
MLRFWIASAAAIAVTRGIRARITRSAAGCRRVLIVGSGPQALRICRELSTDPLTAYQVVGFVDTSDAPRSPFVTRRTIGTLESLESILARAHVDEVHIGLPVKSHYPEIQETIRVCERIGVKVMYGADIFGTELARPCGSRGMCPRVELQLVPEGPAVFVKRVIDLAGAAALLLALAPLMIATAVAIKLTSEGPVIFTQERYGLNRRRFRMLKFRTMIVNAEQLQAALESQNEVQGAAFKIARDPRVTPLGRILRRASIDELPQLFNVLAGDMSLIGPRPLPNRDVERFTRTADMRRFSVRPGLTGLWQVSGRARLVFDEWIRLDLHYIDNWSLLLDFRILARTLPAVVRGTGAA